MAYGDSLDTLVQSVSSLEEGEKLRLANAIMKKKFAGVDITQGRTLLENQRNGNKLPILHNADDFDGFPPVDGCSLGACDFDDEYSEFDWCIKEIGCELTICEKNLTDGFNAFYANWRKMNEGDINSAFVQFLIERFQRRLKNAMFRNAYLGDSEASDSLIEWCNGLNVQYQGLADDSNTVTFSDDYSDELIDDGETIYNTLVEMIEKAEVQPWFNSGNLKIEMNRELVAKLVGYLRRSFDKGLRCECIDADKVVSKMPYSIDNLAIDGIPIRPLPITQAMKAVSDYWDGSDFQDNPNFIVLNTVENDLLGFEDSESMEQFNIGYDKREREIWMQGTALFGVGVPTDQFVIALPEEN